MNLVSLQTPVCLGQSSKALGSAPVTKPEDERLNRRFASVDVKLWAGFVLGLALGCGNVWAKPLLNHDGIYWSKLQNSAKQAYVVGFVDGFATSVQKLEQLRETAKMFHWRAGDHIIRQVQSGLEMSADNPAATVAKLERLYSERRYAELEVSDALQLIALGNSAAALEAKPADRVQGPTRR